MQKHVRFRIRSFHVSVGFDSDGLPRPRFIRGIEPDGERWWGFSLGPWSADEILTFDVSRRRA